MRRVLILALGFLSLMAKAQDLAKDFEKAKFTLDGQSLEAYLADNDSHRERGLMYVESLPVDTGMLFIFEFERELSFWMKNTLIPLSIGFFDRSGKLVDIQEMKVAPSMISQTIPSYRSRTSAQYALEMNSGWFAKRKVKIGARLRLISKVKSAILNESPLVNKVSTGR